uniref:Pyrin domain-containing protein n=1 Tax=Takifugu rubripes TaxID=31033 RepID=A0A3B5KEB3_TAKRU
MAQEILLNVLEHLTEEEFDKFNFYLKDPGVMGGFNPIKSYQLETRERTVVVDLMVKAYKDQGAVEVTKKILEKIPRNDILQNLSAVSSDPTGHSLVQEVQQNLRSGRLTTESLSPAQWSALGFILLSSGQDLEMFDLKKYSASEWVLLRLLPVVTACRKQDATMAQEILLNVLEDLTEEEFDKFNFYLKDPGVMGGFNPIKEGQIDNKKRTVVVDLMVKAYKDQGAVEVTKKILEKIPRNDILQNLFADSSDPTGQFLF